MKMKIIAVSLAEAVAAFDLKKVADLISEKGEFWIEDENEERICTDKSNFLGWLGGCMDEFQLINPDRDRLNYTIDQCLYCKIGNPVILFENGRFPIFTRKPWHKEKCGLILEFENDLISGIGHCYLFVKTDNVTNYERDCLKRRLG